MNTFREILEHVKTLIKNKNFSCGWMSDYTLSLIIAFIKYYRPDYIIHTGVLWGKSTLYILNTLDTLRYSNYIDEITTDIEYTNFINNNRRKPKSTKLILVDPDVFDLGIENIIDYLKEIFYNIPVDYYKMTSDDFFKKELSISNSDFLLGIVDGDHTPEGCKLDLVNLANLGAKVIIVDDISWLPELDKVCSEFAEWHGYNYTKFKFDSGIGLLTR